MAFWCEWASPLSRKRQPLGCSNVEALFQQTAGPFRSYYPHSRHPAASEQLDFTICGGFLMLHLVSREEVAPLGCREQVKCS